MPQPVVSDTIGLINLNKTLVSRSFLRVRGKDEIF